MEKYRYDEGEEFYNIEDYDYEKVSCPFCGKDFKIGNESYSEYMVEWNTSKNNRDNEYNTVIECPHCNKEIPCKFEREITLTIYKK